MSHPRLTPDFFLTCVAREGRNAGPVLLQEAVEDFGVDDTFVRRVICDVWTGAEYPENAVPTEDWVEWFRRCVTDTHIVRDTRKYPRPKRIPTLYRGGHRLDGMSWTSDFETARKFADGISWRPRGGTVWAIETLDPSLVLARIEDRDESEWVIDIARYTRDFREVPYEAREDAA